MSVGLQQKGKEFKERLGREKPQVAVIVSTVKAVREELGYGKKFTLLHYD